MDKTLLFYKLDNAARELRNAESCISDINQDDIRNRSLIHNALANVERVRIAMNNLADINYERLLQLRGYITYVKHNDKSLTFVAQKNGFSYAYSYPSELKEDMSSELIAQRCYQELYRSLEDKANLGY